MSVPPETRVGGHDHARPEPLAALRVALEQAPEVLVVRAQGAARFLDRLKKRSSTASTIAARDPATVE